MNESDQRALLEQYKLYVDIADRLRDRRDRTHRFFTLLNLGGIGLFVGMLGTSMSQWTDTVRSAGPLFPLLAFTLGLVFNVPWGFMISTHRRIAKTKNEVINELEESFQTKPWTSEYKRNKLKNVIWSTDVELFFPLVAGVVYLIVTGLFLYVLIVQSSFTTEAERSINRTSATSFGFPQEWIISAISLVVATLLGTVVGNLLADRSARKRERRLRMHEINDVACALYHELADRAGRCLNDYLAPWKPYRQGTSSGKMPVQRLLKFRPAEPVVYPNLAGRLGLIDADALGKLIHFYFRLDAVLRDIDRWRGEDPNKDLHEEGHTRLMGQRFFETLRPALDALEALGRTVSNYQAIDYQVSQNYNHIAGSGKRLREGLREEAEQPATGA